MNTRTGLRAMQLGLTAWLLLLQTLAQAQTPHREAAAVRLPTGQLITPLAARGAQQQFLNPGLADYPSFVAGAAVRAQLSPDGATLAVLCAGQNSLDKPDGTTDTASSTQYLFLYDVSGPHAAAPALTQVLQQTNAHVGLAFAPDGNTLYAAGGKDDAVYAYAKGASGWSLSKTIALGHASGIGMGVSPNASGLALSRDGRSLVVANNYNDSISVIDTASGALRYEHDLRPYFPGNESQIGGVGGTFPFAVALKDDGTAYVTSDRDREVVVVALGAQTGAKLITRIPLAGNALGLALDHAQARLYVAEDNADQVAVIDTAHNQLLAEIDARAPQGLLPTDDDDEDERSAGKQRFGKHYTGAATFTVSLSPDESTLYAVNAGANAIAVIPLRGDDALRVSGLIPTAYEPRDFQLSADGRFMYIINGKSVTGPNPGHLAGNTAAITSTAYPGGSAAASAAAKASNQYQFQLERASLVSAPVPRRAELERLTARVAENNFYSGSAGQDRKLMAWLRKRIQHVIYIAKENRTFDQMLGDLANGSNGDSSLTQFGKSLTPNQHRLASSFVTLDNFTDPGDGSMDGWAWSLQGRVTNTEAITQQINYAFVDRGLSYESEGTNRNVPVNLANRDPASRSRPRRGLAGAGRRAQSVRGQHLDLPHRG